MTIQSVVVELIDICNLNCAYCLRDEASLHGKAHALPIPELARILAEAKKNCDRGQVVFTGGEPTLHPEFRTALKTVHDLDWRYVLITNGWTFSRALASVLEFRSALEAIAFSIDGFTEEQHDRVRGKGSFERLTKAVAACQENGLPFRIKLTVDRRKGARIAEFVAFAARLGAQVLELGPLLPANRASQDDVMSSREQTAFLRQVHALRRTLKMEIQFAAGFFDPRPEPTCGPLLGTTLNIDYNARLTLCTVLASFRGQEGDRDIVADLRRVPLAAALPGLAEMVEGRNRDRGQAFQAMEEAGHSPSLRLGSPCFDCLCSFGKMSPAPFDTVEAKESMDDAMSFSVSDSVIASEFGGKEALLLDTTNQRYHTLNETATFLWLEIEKERTVAEMAASLCAAFDVTAEHARASVVAALRRFEAQGLIHRSEKPHSSDSASPEVRS